MSVIPKALVIYIYIYVFQVEGVVPYTDIEKIVVGRIFFV